MLKGNERLSGYIVFREMIFRHLSNLIEVFKESSIITIKLTLL